MPTHFLKELFIPMGGTELWTYYKVSPFRSVSNEFKVMWLWIHLFSYWFVQRQSMPFISIWYKASDNKLSVVSLRHFVKLSIKPIISPNIAGTCLLLKKCLIVDSDTLIVSIFRFCNNLPRDTPDISWKRSNYVLLPSRKNVTNRAWYQIQKQHLIKCNDSRHHCQKFGDLEM